MSTDLAFFLRAMAPRGEAANDSTAPDLRRDPDPRRDSDNRHDPDLRHDKVRPLADAWRRPGREPALADVLVDPLVHLVMRRDGVTLPDLLRAIADAQSAARRRLCGRHVA
jgi:hypothetical protein